MRIPIHKSSGITLIEEDPGGDQIEKKRARERERVSESESERERKRAITIELVTTLKHRGRGSDRENEIESQREPAGGRMGRGSDLVWLMVETLPRRLTSNHPPLSALERRGNKPKEPLT